MSSRPMPPCSLFFCEAVSVFGAAAGRSVKIRSPDPAQKKLDFVQQTSPKTICRLARGFAPRFGGNSFGGIQNALAGLGGNESPSPLLWRGRGQSFFKFRIVVIIPKSSDLFPAKPRLTCHARSA